MEVHRDPLWRRKASDPTTATLPPDCENAEVPGLLTAIGGGVLSAPLKGPDGSAAAPVYANATTTSSGMYFAAGLGGANVPGISAAGVPLMAFDATGDNIIRIRSNSGFGWSSTIDPFTAPDLVLYRGGAGILEQKNSTNAQTLRVYGTDDGSGNAEWLEIGKFSGTQNAFIRSNASGTGVLREISIGYGTTYPLRVGGAINCYANILWGADNTYDIGATGANRPRQVYLSGDLYLEGSGSQVIKTNSTITASSPVLNLEQTWNEGATTFTGLYFKFTDTASAAGSLIFDMRNATTSLLSLNKDGGLTANGTIQGSDITGTGWIRANSELRLGASTNIRMSTAGDGLIAIKANDGTTYATVACVPDIQGTDAAAAQTATLTNGPTAGNPSEWIPIKVNGNTRYIPVWT